MATVLHFARMNPDAKWHAIVPKYGAEQICGLWFARCGAYIEADSEKRARVPSTNFCKSCERLLAMDDRR